MGTIIAFPVSRRLGAPADAVPPAQEATVVILPVVRIERDADETSGGGPEQGAAHGRRRRRR